MSTTLQRKGRLGWPSRRQKPKNPTCRRCSTDYYLKFMAFMPTAVADRATPEPHVSAAGLRRWAGFVEYFKFGTGSERTGGAVKYFCQKCGSFHDHDVPVGWEPSVRELTIRDVQALPHLYVGPGEARPSEQLTATWSTAHSVDAVAA